MAVGFGIVRLDAYGMSVRCLGFLEAFQIFQEIAQIVVGTGIVRPDAQG